MRCFRNPTVPADEPRRNLGWRCQTRRDSEIVTFIEINQPNVKEPQEVSETFDGSPIPLDYHFTVGGDKIGSLTID
jgi:hypothetical protein